MMKHILAAALITTAVGARAGMNSALDCLRASAQGAGLAGCMNESANDAPEVSGANAEPPAAAPTLSAASANAVKTRRSQTIPTPLGYTTAEEGSLKAGFYNGLDTGFDAVFVGIVYPAVLGLEAAGAPRENNAGTAAFFALGVLLAIPAVILACALGAPLGAAAGMIAEKISPGSTEDWLTI